jgi:cell division protein FtsB
VISIAALYLSLLLIGLSAQNQRYDKLKADEKPKNQRLKRLEDKMEDLEGKSQSWKDRLPSRKMVMPICTDGSSFDEHYKVLRTRMAGFGVHGPLG